MTPPRRIVLGGAAEDPVDGPVGSICQEAYKLLRRRMLAQDESARWLDVNELFDHLAAKGRPSTSRESVGACMRDMRKRHRGGVTLIQSRRNGVYCYKLDPPSATTDRERVVLTGARPTRPEDGSELGHIRKLNRLLRTTAESMRSSPENVRRLAAAALLRGLVEAGVLTARDVMAHARRLRDGQEL